MFARHDRRKRLQALAASVAVALAVAVPMRALAHADLVVADPAPGYVATSPDHFTLDFSQALDSGSHVQVVDAMGTPLSGVSSAIDRPRVDRMLVRVPSLAPGPYTVVWTSVSAEDGHEQTVFYGLIVGDTTPLDLTDPVAGDAISGDGDIGVQLSAAPDEHGVHHWVASIIGSPVGISRVLFRFTPQMGAYGTQNIVADGAPGSSTYVLDAPITLAGAWRVEVGVRRTDIWDDVRIPFTFDASVAPPPVARAD